MKRANRVILLAHCILNQNAVVKPLARAKGAYEAIITTIMNEGIGLVQLPCPETLHLGLDRLPMSYEEYDTTAFKVLCSNLVTNQMLYIEKLLENGTEIVGILGIESSPSCDQATRKGHFMESLHGIEVLNQLPKLDVPEAYAEDEEATTAFLNVLSEWLKGAVG